MPDNGLAQFSPNHDTAGAAQSCGGSSPSNPPRRTSWIGIELVDEKGNGISGVDYEIVLPDGAIKRGQTGYGRCRPNQTEEGEGRALLESIDPGTCQVSFPFLDKGAWKPG